MPPGLGRGKEVFFKAGRADFFQQCLIRLPDRGHVASLHGFHTEGAIGFTVHGVYNGAFYGAVFMDQ